MVCTYIEGKVANIAVHKDKVVVVCVHWVVGDDEACVLHGV